MGSVGRAFVVIAMTLTMTLFFAFQAWAGENDYPKTWLPPNIQPVEEPAAEALAAQPLEEPKAPEPLTRKPEEAAPPQTQPSWNENPDWEEIPDWIAADAEPSGTGIDSFEDLLTRQDGVEFQHQGRTYVWVSGIPHEKNSDGSLTAVEAPENLYVRADDGRKWLSREADGTIFIEVSPKIWATINFAHNSDVIDEDSKPVLDVFGQSLKSPALSEHRLIIAGHTSSAGNADYNLKLSRRRAQSVARYLAEEHQINPERLILHGYGDTKPIDDNLTEEGQALNRRVEFILLGPS